MPRDAVRKLRGEIPINRPRVQLFSTDLNLKAHHKRGISDGRVPLLARICSCANLLGTGMKTTSVAKSIAMFKAVLDGNNYKAVP